MALLATVVIWWVVLKFRSQSSVLDEHFQLTSAIFLVLIIFLLYQLTKREFKECRIDDAYIILIKNDQENIRLEKNNINQITAVPYYGFGRSRRRGTMTGRQMIEWEFVNNDGSTYSYRAPIKQSEELFDSLKNYSYLLPSNFDKLVSSLKIEEKVGKFVFKLMIFFLVALFMIGGLVIGLSLYYPNHS